MFSMGRRWWPRQNGRGHIVFTRRLQMNSFHMESTCNMESSGGVKAISCNRSLIQRLAWGKAPATSILESLPSFTAMVGKEAQ